MCYSNFKGEEMEVWKSYGYDKWNKSHRKINDISSHLYMKFLKNTQAHGYKEQIGGCLRQEWEVGEMDEGGEKGTDFSYKMN